MVSITFSLDEESKREMERFSWVNWSELARGIFLERIKKQEALNRLDKLMKESRLTDEDIAELAKKAMK